MTEESAGGSSGCSIGGGEIVIEFVMALFENIVWTM
jgi:hypothetical protein